ncbi:uncharacterized protein LOC113138747 [Mastacembelus armatus]|uniref:uncharacterized protein LOC113138747 n=1 Tax=Mastacembelus armatus TaxID=205130 RepID=UPI000E45D1AE|nr:uncharacterized protein LOC113138747 [Mastacembelus armatus]
MAAKIPIPALAETAYTLKKGKRRKTFAEKEERRKETNRARFKSRIYIGMAFTRWRELREERHFQTDTDLALFLLDCYDNSSVTSSPSKFTHKPPGLPPLSTIEAESISERGEDILSEIEELEEDAEPQQLETSVSVNRTGADVNVKEFNDIRNSTIDWNGDTSDPTTVDDFNSDEDNATPLCVRTGGVESGQFRLDLLPGVSLDETVYGLMDQEESGPSADSGLPHKLEVLCEDDIVGHEASIVYHDSLKQLVTHLILPVKTCTAKDPAAQVECHASQPFEVKVTSQGTAAAVEWVCPSGHTVWSWTSQPSMKSGMQVGDFMLATNILLSGNNYEKVALLFKNMNMGMVDPKTFSLIQDTYCVETIKGFWEERRLHTVTKLCDKNLIVLGGGRTSSLGCYAKYCTYTAMDSDSKEILSIVNMDNMQAQKNSVIMETEAFIQTVDKLKGEIKIQEVCTDAHRQISALFSKGKYRESGISYSWDIWHGVKDLGKRLQVAGRSKGCSPILHWIKDICNHFWYCCKEAGNYDEFMSLWTAVLHHVTDEHEWATGACHHGPLPKNHSNIWIEQDSVAHRTLISVIMNQRWLKDVEKFLTFRSTEDLESFHSHISMYAPKRFSFSPHVYEARVLLAGLDYNHHVHRPAVKNRDGALVYRKVWNKRSRRWSLCTVKLPKDYSYIPDLQSAILRRRLADDEGREPADPGAPAASGASSQQETWSRYHTRITSSS